MIQINDEHLYILDQLIAKKQLFAAYKMPQSDTWHFVMQESGHPQLLTDLSQLNEEEGYVIAPFQVSEGLPIVLLHIDRRTLPSREELEKYPIRTLPTEKVEDFLLEGEMKQKYKDCFDSFMQPLQENAMAKLVLSRHRVQKKEKDLSLAKAFEMACNSYPNGYVYLVHTPQTGVWMGSTPEIILAGKKQYWQTVALAGTKPYVEGKAPLWDAKNRREQDLVAQYVQHQLNAFGIEPEIEGPVNIKAAQVVHLVSHFSFQLEQNNRLGDLLKLLHPTPAVCGLPKEEAYRFILENEHHNRKYYSGFIGELSPYETTNLFVNLRCMQIHSKSYTLYAGGGLLSSSILDEEWQETENKMQTMRALLQ